DTQELAHKFGFIARAPNPAAQDLDEREGLPVGMHLTTDPITGVPFVVTNCTLCHAEKVGDRVIVGLGNKRVRVPAYDAAFVRIAPKLSVDKLARLANDAAGERRIKWPDAYRDAIFGRTVAPSRKPAHER